MKIHSKILVGAMSITLLISLTLNATVFASRYAFGDRDGWLRNSNQSNQELKEADGEIMIYEGKKAFIEAGVFDEVVQINNDIQKYNETLNDLLYLKGKITIGTGDVKIRMANAVNSGDVSDGNIPVLANYVTKISMPTLQRFMDTNIQPIDAASKIYIEEWDVEIREKSIIVQDELYDLLDKLQKKMDVLPGDNAN